MRRALLPCIGLVAFGCSAEPRPELLSDLPAYSGRLTVQVLPGDGRARLDGQLEFDRATRRVSFSQRRDGPTIVLRKDGEAALLKTRDGSPETLTLDDIGDFALLQQLLFSAPEDGAQVVSTAGGYTIAIGDRRIEVAMTPGPSDVR